MSFADILQLLSPEALGGEVEVLVWAREEFVVDVGVVTWGGVQEEVVRLVRHVHRRVYASGHRELWPRFLAERDAEGLLVAVFGRLPRRGVMRVVERDGVRALVDRLVAHLREVRVGRYVDARVVPLLVALSPAERYAFAEAYLAEFGVLAGVELQHPLHYAVMSDDGAEWRRALHEHARLVLQRA